LERIKGYILFLFVVVIPETERLFPPIDVLKERSTID